MRCGGGSTADGDADRTRRAEPRERPHDHALTEQCVEERIGVVAALDVEKVADGRADDVESGVAQNAFQLCTSLRVQLTAACELVGRVEARERGLLRRGRQVESPPRLPELRHELCSGNAV